MPDGLGRRGLSDLVDRAIVTRRQRCIALIVLDVAILKDFGVASEEGVVLVVGWTTKVAVLAVSSMLKTGTVLKHVGLAGDAAGSTGNDQQRRGHRHYRRESGRICRVVLVETNEGPCWAKNQSVALVSGVPSAFMRAKSATFCAAYRREVRRLASRGCLRRRRHCCSQF